MAKRISAVGTYCPRIDAGELVTTEELSEYIARGTALNPGEIYNVLHELQDAILFFAARGSPIRIEKIGIFRPRISIDGTFRISFRLAVDIRRGLNAAGMFTGTIVNKENIGKTIDDLIDMWNADHLDDPIVEPAV